ncbi:hypothetical protein [Rhizobium sp. CRRU65]|uniref:hypothetical protein n=1 Tax=Rhizobium sp. CRRU65 TaxID=3399566 RepID=UPI003AF99A21
MKVGTISTGSATWELTGTSFGSYTSGLDGSLSATLSTGVSFAHVGPLFARGTIDAIELDDSMLPTLPATIDFQAEPGLVVAALCLRNASEIRLYLPSTSDGLSGRWVDIPRMPEFQAMAASDKDWQRKAWIAALEKVSAADWPDGIDLSRRNLTALSAPSLRILLALLGSYACPVTTVNQPDDRYRGGQTRGVTLPLLRYPVSEPDCYVRVISGREGLLESVNAYDLEAGISVGPIQFNVHRAAIFKFLQSFSEGDPYLFHSCFSRFSWSPRPVSVGGIQLAALNAVDAAGDSLQLVGREADHARNCGYFQSGIAGRDDFDDIDAIFRKTIAAAFRDAVTWPHVQESLMAISSEWLARGLERIDAAGIPAVDAMRPDRDTFVLKAVLLSAYVRYSACLIPLLKALKPYVSPAAKLAAINHVLLASDTWSDCNHTRRTKLAARIAAQKPEAIAAWEVIDRLANSHAAPAGGFSASLAGLPDTDDDGCDHDVNLLTEALHFWEVQAAATLTQVSNVGQQLQSLIAREVGRAQAAKPSRKAGRALDRHAKLIGSGDLVVKISKSGGQKLAIVDAVDGPHLYVRNLKGAAKRWRCLDAGGHARAGVFVLRPSKAVARKIAALREELVFLDPTLAIPPFNDDERRVVLTPLLPSAVNRSALLWNQQRHPGLSAVSLGRIAAALEAYVDFASVAEAIAATQGAAAATSEAVLIEAIHQFQYKTFIDAGQHDGRCGESTLDNLGLYLGRPGLNQVDVANPTAQAHLNRINRRLAGIADNPAAPATLNAANWFLHMTAPAFLGHPFRNGIHAVLLRRLRTAERHLLDMPVYRGLTPVRLGQALGIQEFHRGSRPSAATGSMHTFGLATDINYIGNPWIEGDEIVPVFQRAHRLVAGLILNGGPTVARLFHAIAKKPTAEIYDFLWSLDRSFRTYLTLHDDAEELRHVIDAHHKSGTAGIFNPGETVEQATNRWHRQIESDLADLNGHDGFVGRNPRNGFLNLEKDLVVALRDVGCLAWGASDFGPGQSGDMMHFDCRNTGLGQVINKGFAPPERRCA